jgi:transposase
MEAKRQEMSTPLKQVIIELFSNGEKVSDIASSVNRSLSSAYRVIRKFESTGSTENLPRSGRPRSIDDREYRRLQRIVNKDRRAPLRDITAEFNDRRATSVSQKAIKRRLKENGFSRGVYRKKVVIKSANRKKRLSWCREKRRWDVQNRY